MWEKEYAFLKGYAHGKEYLELELALVIAKQSHSGQFRKAMKYHIPEPYVSHPIRVASHLMSLGIDDETTLVAAVLHDVIEDTDVNKFTLSTAGISDDSIEAILLVSKTGKMNDEQAKTHFDNILFSKEASLVKVSDRVHNVSTMVGAFTDEKVRAYIDETRTYILPLAKKAKDRYPIYSNALVSMQYQIESILEFAEMYLEKMKDRDD